MKQIVLLLFLLTSIVGLAQVGVNTTTPDPSSMLDISATNKGVLVPRVSLPNVTTTQLDGTNTAATGLLIWNTNAATVGGNGVGFYFFNGTQWMPLTQAIAGNTLDQAYDQGGAGVGKNINATDGSVRVNGDDGFLVTGTFGTGNIINTEITGAGTRMFFNPRKAAFRAGSVFGNEWDDSNIGDFSIALGRGTIASNTYDIAIGFGSTASGSYSTTLGWANTASGAYSFSMGQNSVASGWSSTVLGRISSALADNSLVFGNNSTTNGQSSFAIGNYAETFGSNSMALGNNVTSRSGYESVFGIYNTDYTPLSVGGFNNADRLFVIGNGTNATNLSNALTIYKDGRMNINDAYTMPTSDGTNGQVMQTNGSGIVSWATPATATDDQQIDVLSLTGDTLNISLQDDGVPTQTLNLSAIDNQSTDVFNLTGSTLNLSLQNDGVPTQTVDLSPLRDHDWYEVGGTTQPDAITDNIYHSGNAVIGKNMISAELPILDIENSTSSSTTLKVTDLSTGTAPHRGITLNMHSTTAASEWGILVSHNNPNASLKYGILSSVENGSGNNSAFQGRVRGTGENNGSGIIIFDSGSASSSEQTGYSTIFGQPTSEESFGLRNTFNTNNITNDTGNKYGVYNLFGGNVGGTIYGLYNNFDLINNSTFNKYGSYTRIPSLMGGTHYGIYSDVTKAGSYAGYFLGNVSIGTTTTNNYILPSARGTNGQVMQTDGTGNVTWINPSTVDNQQIDVLSLTGDTLNISLQDDGVATQTLNLAAIDNQGTDVFSLTGTTLNLSLQNDGIATQTVDLSSLLGTDDQNLTTPTLVGTTLNLGIENGTGTSINLASLDTDNQQIDVLTLTGDTLNISLQDDGVATQTLNLAAIDNQGTDVFSLTGTTLNLSLQNDGVPTQTVNLAALDTDNQQIDVLSLTGDTLNISLQDDGIPTQTINLAAIDNQAIDTFSLVGTTLGISLQNDGQPLQTVNLASLVGTDDQNLTTPTLVGTTLNLGIENGTGTSINLAPLDTDNQQIDVFSLTGTTLNLSLQDDGVATQTVDLSPLLGDDDWTDVGANIERQSGDVYIGDTATTNNNLYISNQIIDWDNTGYSIDPNGDSFMNEIQFDSGTATDPSIRFFDVDTGFFSPGAGSTAFSNNGVESFRIHNTGNISMGQTIDPNYKFSASTLGNTRNVKIGNTNFNESLIDIDHDGQNGNGMDITLSSAYTLDSRSAISTTNTWYDINVDITRFDHLSTELYGIKSIVNSNIIGSEYGIYAEALQADGYAGYFLGRTSIGTTTTNNYILPASRGTNGQIMQTDGSGNVSWVNPAVDTDNQQIDVLSLTGDTLNISLQDDAVATQTLNLSAIDNQAIDVFSLTGTTLNLSLQNDSVATQTVDLSPLANDWKLTGNAGTNPTTNFIGTTDNQDFSIRTNNTEKVRITAKGQIETTQAQSVWVGSQAGENISTGTRNTFVGHLSGLNSTTGSDNTAFGGLSLSSNVAGFDNTAIGLAALNNLNTGDGNTAVGEQVAENMTTGNYNTIIGHLAAENYTTGNRNTILGYQAGQNAAGDGNVFIGSSAGRSETGSNKLYIENSGVDEDNALLYGEFDNNILRTYGEFQVRQNSSTTLSHIQLREDTVNDGARIKFTNAAEIVNSWTLFGRADDTTADSRFNIFHTTTGNIMQFTGDGLVGIMRTPTTNQLEINGTASKSAAGGFLANSDRRLKKNITTISPSEALNKVLSLRGVTYEWNDDKTGMKRPEGNQIGFVAQEIQEVFPEKVSEDKLGYLQTAYGDYDPIIFQAIKALSDKIDKLEKENEELKALVKNQK